MKIGGRHDHYSNRVATGDGGWYSVVVMPPMCLQKEHGPSHGRIKCDWPPGMATWCAVGRVEHHRPRTLYAWSCTLRPPFVCMPSSFGAANASRCAAREWHALFLTSVASASRNVSRRVLGNTRTARVPSNAHDGHPFSDTRGVGLDD